MRVLCVCECVDANVVDKRVCRCFFTVLSSVLLWVVMRNTFPVMILRDSLNKEKRQLVQGAGCRVEGSVSGVWVEGQSAWCIVQDSIVLRYSLNSKKHHVVRLCLDPKFALSLMPKPKLPAANAAPKPADTLRLKA